MFKTDRLGQIIEGAGLEGRHRILGAAESGDHRHRHLRMMFGDIADDIESVAVGQSHVGQAQLEIPLGKTGPSLADRADAGSRQSHPRQGEVDQFADIGLVIDDEDPVQVPPRAPFASGNRHVSLLPTMMKWP